MGRQAEWTQDGGGGGDLADQHEARTSGCQALRAGCRVQELKSREGQSKNIGKTCLKQYVLVADSPLIARSNVLSPALP